MKVRRRKSSSSPAPSQPAEAIPPRRIIAFGVFAIMAIGAPLFFGAVDPLPQIGLLVLLLIGILAQPPATVPLSRWGNRLAITFIAILLIKEFAPAALFGETTWRHIMKSEFALDLPFTHHPEPGRAITGMLAGTVGVIWFLWVRRLAADRESRPVLAWTLFVAGAIVAVVAFATRNPNSEAIYGLRYTPGWSGFGPFPNRNHSANYFAMAAILGCGCVTWAGSRKRWWLMGTGLGLVVVIVIALLMTESRGGLLAFAVGLGVYLALCLLKVRNRKALGVAVAGALVLGSMALAFGSQVFSRFHAPQGTDVSALTRLHIWQEAIGMWKDAPLFGHGIGSFASIFPLYQRTELENQIVIHPESSWLQWLTELGAVPVLLAVAAGVLFFGGQLRQSFARNRSFYFRASGFAAGAAILVHALIDVPAHRWGTAGFALAALGIACPMRLMGRRTFETQRVALVPLVIALFWTMPLLWDIPRWSPLSLTRLISRQSVIPGVSFEELQAGIRSFPLNAELHQSAGFRLLQLQGKEGRKAWEREFAIAARLVPGSWYVTSAQARSIQRLSPSMALPYWQQSVARGGIHRDEILGDAIQQTGFSPQARAEWGRYVETHPQLLLAFARMVPEVQAPYYYNLWWRQRARKLKDNRPVELSPSEIRDFYALAGRLGHREQLDDWMTDRREFEANDFREWARLLHGWGDDDRAWKLLAAHTAEPAFPAKAPTVPRPQLETAWRTSPQNFVNAQQLAQIRDIAGDQAGRDEVIVAAATSPTAPPWFVEKGAHILARQGKIPEAVTLLLRPR